MITLNNAMQAPMKFMLVVLRYAAWFLHPVTWLISPAVYAAALIGMCSFWGVGEISMNVETVSAAELQSLAIFLKNTWALVFMLFCAIKFMFRPYKSK